MFVSDCKQIPEDARSNAWVSFDGKRRQQLSRGDSVRISMSQHPLPTVNKFDQTGDWFRSLIRCLNWNERRDQKALWLEICTRSSSSLRKHYTSQISSWHSYQILNIRHVKKLHIHRKAHFEFISHLFRVRLSVVSVSSYQRMWNSWSTSYSMILVSFSPSLPTFVCKLELN